MADSLLNQSTEQRLKWGVSLINKGKRLGLLTDALVAAATSFQDLLDDIGVKFQAATIEDNLIHQDKEEIFLALKRELKYLNGVKLGAGTSALSDALVVALTTVNTAAAATDLRHLFASLISEAGFDRTREDIFNSGVGATAY